MSHAGIQLGEGTRAHLVEVVVDFGGGLVDGSDDDEVLLAGELGDESHDVGRCRCIEAAAWVTTKIQQGFVGLQPGYSEDGKDWCGGTWWARPG